MFASVSLDGFKPYSILDEQDYEFIQIPLHDGKMPETFDFKVTADDNMFNDESLKIFNRFLRMSLMN